MKTALPSLKVPIDKSISSNIIYKLTCTGCNSSYIGYTARHMITRKNEHVGKRGIVGKHFHECKENHNKIPEIEVLKGSYRGMIHLSILEALFIREQKPLLNTKDEYIHRPLRIRI